MIMHEATGVIWIISDGIPGEYNQSLAVAVALTRKGYGPIFWVKARRIRGALRPLPSWLLDMTQGPLPRLADVAFTAGELPAQSPRLIISSNVKTAHANVVLSRRHQASSIFIGVPRGLSARHFSVIMHTRKDWSPENGFRMDLLPTRLSAAAARESSEAFRAELGLDNQRLCAMLIGGNSGSHTFERGAWEALAKGMNRLAEADRFKWLVTSSRRTGTEAETILRSILDPALVAHATWWGSQPRPIVPHYLSVSDAVFCTQDSRTMLSEGLASGRPVYALLPGTIDDRDAEEGFAVRYERSQRLRRVKIAEMDQIDLAGDIASYFKVITTDVMDELAERLIAMLDGRASSAAKAAANVAA